MSCQMFVRLFGTFVFILASTVKVIRERYTINVVSQPGIEPGTLRFQDNHETHETHYATETTSVPNSNLNLREYVI